MDYKLLLDAAREARSFAYAPYSNFRVGAALLTESGKVYTGCNVENLSFGATVCAERTAICKAVSDGERKFSAIAVYGGDELTSPCGICLQTLSEFCRELDIILFDASAGYSVHHLSELMMLPSIPLKEHQ